MTAYWCAAAQLPDGVARRVRLVTAEEKLATVTADTDSLPGDVTLPGLVMPGVANGHSHLFHRGLRARTHGGGGTFWTWREEMYAVAARLDPGRYHLLARATLLEMLHAGWTAVGEFHYLHHAPSGRRYADPNAMGEAIIAAAGEVGIRLTLLDTCYLRGGLTADGYLEPDPVQQRYSDGDVAAWAQRVSELREGSLTRIGAAAHSVRALTRPELAAFAQAVGDRPVHAHVSEQPAENAACLAAHGLTPTALLDEAGLLGEHFTSVHATHLVDDDIDRYARSGSFVCFCPSTEADLADGIGPARVLHERGIPLTVGSDQNAIIDPFVELRGLELHERLASGQRGRFTPQELRTVAGPAGYASLGWPGGGAIKAGALADFIAVRTDSARTAGAVPGQILFAAGAPDITDVVVGGQHVIRSGEHALGPVGPRLTEALNTLREDLP